MTVNGPAPAPFSAFTTPEFWDDDHISAQMLAAHLAPNMEAASRTHEFIDRSARWIVEVLGLGRGDRVLDLGCGPGLYACRIAHDGVIVHGVDVSRRSVAHARKIAHAANLPATFDVANYLEGDLGGPYNAALLIYEDICALSPQQRAGLLRRVRDSLVPGAALMMDVTAAPRFERERPGIRREVDLDDGFWAEPSYEGVHETFTYPDLRLILERYTITKDNRTRQFWNWMHCLTPELITAELAATGFKEPALWGDLAGAPYDPMGETFAIITHRQ